jgi:hypothetical protein
LAGGHRHSEGRTDLDLARDVCAQALGVGAKVFHPDWVAARPHLSDECKARIEADPLRSFAEALQVGGIRKPATAWDELRRVGVEYPCLAGVDVKGFADRLHRQSQRIFNVVRLADCERQLAHEPELFLGSLAGCDVVQEGVEALPSVHLVRRDRQLHRELAPLSVQRGDLEPLVQHRPLSGREVTLEAAPVSLAVLLGDDRVRQHAPDRLFPGPAEGPLRLGVPVGDEPVGVHRDEGLVRSVDHRSQLFATPPARHAIRGPAVRPESLDPDALLSRRGHL